MPNVSFVLSSERKGVNAMSERHVEVKHVACIGDGMTKQLSGITDGGTGLECRATEIVGRVGQR